MIFRSFLTQCLFLLLTLGNANANEQLDFNILFANNKIGTIAVSMRIQTPMEFISVSGNVGTYPIQFLSNQFEGVSETSMDGSKGQSSYYSFKKNNFKARSIKFETTSGVLTKIDVDPPTEGTELSSIEFDHPEFINPAIAFIKLLRFPCSGSFNIFDGRRIAEVTPKHSASPLSCKYFYKVSSGPGHLKPFSFRKIDILVERDSKEEEIAQRLIANSSLFDITIIDNFTE